MLYQFPTMQALLECVRLRTFGRYGLQQMQVDCHYLQVYLWKFVSDEQLVRVLLEQVMASTMERCADTTLMEQSVSATQLHACVMHVYPKLHACVMHVYPKLHAFTSITACLSTACIHYSITACLSTACIH